MDAERNPDASGLRDLAGIEVMTRQTLADGVYERLRIAITRGDLPEGTELNKRNWLRNWASAGSRSERLYGGSKLNSSSSATRFGTFSLPVSRPHT